MILDITVEYFFVFVDHKLRPYSFEKNRYKHLYPVIDPTLSPDALDYDEARMIYTVFLYLETSHFETHFFKNER